MRPGAKLTDREILDRLIRYGKLSPAEARVFAGFYEKLTSGALAELSPKHRLWVEAIYQGGGVGALRASARSKARRAHQAGKQVERPSTWFETMPLPKRPPGR